MRRDKYDNLGDIDYPSFHECLENTVFVVQKICETKKNRKEVFEKLWRYMLQGFERPEVRKHPLKFKFSTEESEPIRTMEVRHFLLNLILWDTFRRFDKLEELNASQIYDFSQVTQSTLYEFINEHIIEPYARDIDSETINHALNFIVYHFSMVYAFFATIIGLTLDMDSFNQLKDRSKRFEELINTHAKEGMQPREIEEMLAERLEEEIQIIINDKENNIRPFLIAGVGINPGQLSQFSIMGGLKPDIEGNVVPVPIDSNYINGGLNSVTNFYIDGQAGCKPLILNKTVMGKSGYFSYKTMTLASAFRLSPDIDDCHSARPIVFHVASKAHLKKIDKRYYVDKLGELHLIHYKKDMDLIGQTILLRDPVTCCGHNGICHICYGDTYYTNNSPEFNPGRFAATQINDPLGQNILSSKHMNKTVSTMIEFTEGFNRFFTLNTNIITLNMSSDENFKDWKIMIDEEDYYVADEIVGVEDYNIQVEKFSLVNKKTNETILIQEKENRDFFLFGSFAEQLKHKDGFYSILLSKLDTTEPLAAINVVNNELSAPLKNIIKLLDRKDHFGCETVDDMVNTFTQLLIDSGIRAMSVHASMMVKGLIRDKDNILIPPDFSSIETCDNYQILRVTDGLISNPSLCVSMSFDNINKQIISPITYVKYKPSDYDIYYKESIYQDSLQYYKERKRKKREKHMKRFAEKLRKERAAAAAAAKQ